MEQKIPNYFQELNSVDVSNYIEKKDTLSYLSWSNAWAEVKKRYPDTQYKVYENDNGWNYHTDGKTCWVKTGVTVNGLEHIEYLPVMDFKNKSIPAEAVTSFDVNKAIQRSLTKAVARHGLGLYIYAGEDIPNETAGASEKSALMGQIVAKAGGAGISNNALGEIVQRRYKVSGKDMTLDQCRDLLANMTEYYSEMVASG